MVREIFDFLKQTRGTFVQNVHNAPCSFSTAGLGFWAKILSGKENYGERFLKQFIVYCPTNKL